MPKVEGSVQALGLDWSIDGRILLSAGCASPKQLKIFKLLVKIFKLFDTS